MIRHIDSELDPMIALVDRELKRFHLSETHELFRKKGTAKIMRDISLRAKEMTSELVLIQRRTKSFGNELQMVQQNLDKLEAERQGRALPDITGFGKR